jgi:hypothetical protein
MLKACAEVAPFISFLRSSLAFQRFALDWGSGSFPGPQQAVRKLQI